MIGYVDDSGRALMEVELSAETGSATVKSTVWIDTGFTGDLVLTAAQIEQLELPLTGTVSAVLADGSEVAMKTHACSIHWFDERRHLEVVESDGDRPLLGVGLLLDHELQISYRSNTVNLD